MWDGSTLAKNVSSDEGNGTSVNATLEIVCRFATALGIPPAFLLMRQDDRASLAVAAITFNQPSGLPNFVAMAQEIMDSRALDQVGPVAPPLAA
jgi:hypothetical protein